MSNGDLARTIELTRVVLSPPDSVLWEQAVRQLSFAALLARDDEALRLAVETADRALRRAPALAEWASNARHRLELLQGRPSTVNPLVHDPTGDLLATCGTLWLVSREAMNAGAADAAVDYVQRAAHPLPHPQAVRAAVEAAATGDEDRWHDALAIALEQGLRLIAADALEGIALAAARIERWAECLRLLGAAQRLRDETGYRWRFGYEQRAVDNARTIAVDALGDDAVPAEAAGSGLDWRAAAAYASRARRQR